VTRHSQQAVSGLRQLVTGLSPRMPEINSSPTSEGLVLKYMALGRVYYPCKYYSAGTPCSFLHATNVA